MKRYIKIYNNVLDKSVCNEMIELFDQNPRQYEEHNNDVMNFKQINMHKNRDTWDKYIKILQSNFELGIKQYKFDCKIEDFQWPDTHGFEEFRIKRYEPNEGIFNEHVDAVSLSSAKRFLVFFLYLNSGSVPEDGGTEFSELEVISPRTQGAMLMFPPLWTYPHIGLKPTTSPKYIVGSYLHYV